MDFGMEEIGAGLQARWQRTATVSWTACLLLAFSPLSGRCQKGPVHLHIDAGATMPDYHFTDSAGNAWSGDTFYIGGGTETFGDNIAQAANGTGNVYQTNRIGRQFQYSFIGLQPEASYAVSLLFCELYFTDPTARLFNITFNGEQDFLSDFSIFQAAGGKDIAYDASFMLDADPAGTLTFLFVALKDNAIVSGLKIRDALPPAASPSQAPAGSSQPGAPAQAPVSGLQQSSSAAPRQSRAHNPLAPSYVAPMLAPLQLPDQFLVPAPAPVPLLTVLPPPAVQAPQAPLRIARLTVLAPAPIAAPTGPPLLGHPQLPVLAPASDASLYISSAAMPQPSSGFMLPFSPAPAPNQAEPFTVFLVQSGSPSGVPLPAQAPEQEPPLAPASGPQAGSGLVTPALAVSATAVNQSSASTVSSQVSASTVTVTTTVTAQAPPIPSSSSGSSPADLSSSEQSVNAEDVRALAASAAAEEDAKYVHLTKGQVAGLIIGLWLGLVVVDTVTLVVAIMAIKVRRAQDTGSP